MHFSQFYLTAYSLNCYNLGGLMGRQWPVLVFHRDLDTPGLADGAQ
jgi:hypothetical protein